MEREFNMERPAPSGARAQRGTPFTRKLAVLRRRLTHHEPVELFQPCVEVEGGLASIAAEARRCLTARRRGGRWWNPAPARHLPAAAGNGGRTPDEPPGGALAAGAPPGRAPGGEA